MEAHGYLGRKYEKCTGKSSKRFIRWERYLRRFMFLFAVSFLSEKCMPVDTRQFSILRSLFNAFFIATFMPEVLFHP